VQGRLQFDDVLAQHRIAQARTCARQGRLDQAGTQMAQLVLTQQGRQRLSGQTARLDWKKLAQIGTDLQHRHGLVTRGHHQRTMWLDAADQVYRLVFTCGQGLAQNGICQRCCFFQRHKSQAMQN